MKSSVWKYVLFVFILSGGLLATHYANAQVQLWQWAKADSASGSNDNAGEAITTDQAGNVYATGYFESPATTFGSVILTNDFISGGLNDLFVVKYDPAGNVIWAVSGNGSSANMGNAITTDVAGNLYVAGAFYSTITFGTTTLTRSPASGLDAGNMFLAKYDSAGNIIWAVAASSDSDALTGVTTDSAANVYVVGQFFGPTLTLGAIVLSNPGPVGAKNVFIAKYDSAGNVIWARSAGTAGGNAQGYATGIKTDANGNEYVSGEFGGPSITFGTTTFTNSGAINTFDIFIAKYDSAGNFIWAKSAAGSTTDYATCITTDAAGNVYEAGYYASPTLNFGSTTITNTSGGLNDIFIVKYDATGDVVWVQNFGNAGATFGADLLAITISDSGYIYATGYFGTPIISFGADTLTNVGGTDIYVVKLDTAGNPLWAMSAGGSGNDQGYGITTSPPYNVYTTGYFQSPVISFGTTTLTRTGEVNVFVAKIITLVPITGDSMACTGDSLALSDLTTGGTWSSGNTAVATVNAVTGVVAGISAGTATITYMIDTDYVTQMVTVNPSPAAIMGDSQFCFYINLVPDSTILSDATAGGIWSSTDTSLVIIDSAGIAKAGSGASVPGTDDTSTIVYTLSTGCFVTLGVNGMYCLEDIPSITNNSTIIIYPNPANDELTVQLTGAGINEITITNLLGQTMITPYSLSPKTRTAWVNVSSLPPGMYFVNIGGQTRKFVKQ